MFTIMQKFSDWLISAMNERGWNQAALARAAGLTPTAISNLITGKRNPGIDSCIPIANALKLPAETVLLAAGLIEQEPDKDERLYKVRLIGFVINPARAWRVRRKTCQDHGGIPGAVAEHDARKYKHDRQIYRLSKR